MSWIRLDDGFPSHPKVAGLSDAAFRLYVTAVCYAGQHLTDGVVTVAALPHAKSSTVRELLAARLFEKTDRGLVIHDYLDYQPTAAEVREILEKKKAAGAAGGNAKAANALAKGLAPAIAPARASAREIHSLPNVLAKGLAPARASGREIPYLPPIPSPPPSEGKEREGAARPSHSGFSPPSIEEVRKEIAAKNYTFTAERFVAENEATGWRGVTDWRAKARAWQAIEKPKPANGQPRVYRTQDQLDREAEAEQIRKNREADARRHRQQDDDDVLLGEVLESLPKPKARTS